MLKKKQNMTLPIEVRHVDRNLWVAKVEDATPFSSAPEGRGRTKAEAIRNLREIVKSVCSSGPIFQKDSVGILWFAMPVDEETWEFRPIKWNQMPSSATWAECRSREEAIQKIKSW